ncbi:MAG: hypothetical protein OEX19_07855, partial [Gammaproteobacteria bacterium]|nr:hypothetical protein [Gammaproteobacteria bacterium]
MRIRIYATVLLLFLSPLASCEKSEVANLYSPQEWRDLLEEAGGWAPLVFPDSKYEPGSIIQVKKSGIRWIDHLSSCRYPPEAISPKEGLIPNIRFTSSWEIDASAMLNIKNISAGPQFDKVKKVHLAVQDHGADAFHLIRFRIWQQDPANRDKFSSLCMDELAKPDHYLVTEAFRISR